MNLFTAVTQPTAKRYSFEEYAHDASQFFYNGLAYQGNPLVQTYDQQGRTTEMSADNFAARIQNFYKGNGAVFACQQARHLLFTEARLMWQQMRAGRPADRFWTRDLLLAEKPWFNGSTGELLGRMLQDTDFAGNNYTRRTDPSAENQQLERLRPDWTVIVMGSRLPPSVDPAVGLLSAEVLGYGYQEGGFSSDADPVFLDRSEVAHWSPIPDPVAHFRGMSWLTPIIREVRGDTLATEHKLQFFDHAATPNLVVKFDPSVPFEKFQKFKDAMELEHRGAVNAYKTMYLGGGADATAVGLSFKEMDFKVTQGAGETRIAAAAGVPPVIVGLSEGLAAATYSNYAQARRRFADMTIRPLWRSACAALETILPPPSAARLWYDDRDIPALQEDEKDAAEIQKVKAGTIAQLVREGFTAESVVAAVENEDMTLLKHTGRLSVQLQKPGEDAGGLALDTPPEDTPPPEQPALPPAA